MSFYLLRINKSWLLSRVAQRVYLIAACLSLLLLQYIVALYVAMAHFGEDAVFRAAGLQVLSRLVVPPGVLGATTLWVAMWYFWFNFDESSSNKRVVWFLLLLIGLPVTLIYYAAVYRRSQRLEGREPIPVQPPDARNPRTPAAPA